MRRYKERVPAVQKIVSSMVAKGIIDHEDEIINDHIAFRTLGVPHLGIQSLEKLFLAYGYTRQDYYHFPKKKLNAYWYSPPSFTPNLPRIFISECRVHEFSDATQAIVGNYTQSIQVDPVLALDIMDGGAVDTFLHTRLWEQPTWEDFSKVAQESEYVSWVLNNRYYLNHFTISTHALKHGFDSLETFNDFLESIGVQLNDSGGKIKTSADGKLRQSSSVSNKIKVAFNLANGNVCQQWVSGSYVEFAQRIDGREGFDPGNANHIFESTYSNQVDRLPGQE